MVVLRERLPKEEWHKLREAAVGFQMDIRVTYPAWFEEKTTDRPEEEAPSTERDVTLSSPDHNHNHDP
jgi:hypothetical protein